MHFTDSSTLSDPVRVASLALSLLQAHAYQSLLVISSSSIQDRYILTFDTHTDPLSLFQWQTDSARELLWKWDAHGSLFNDSNMYYRVLDAETTQCCIPFARNGESTGLVVLLKTAADTWTFHNLLETAMDLPTYFQDWSLSLEEAEKTGPKSIVSHVPTEERPYWDQYDVVTESQPASQVIDDPNADSQKTTGEDDDYWASYDSSAPGY